MKKEYNIVFQMAILPTSTAGNVLVPVCRYHCKTHKEMDALEKKLCGQVKGIFKMYREIYRKK